MKNNKRPTGQRRAGLALVLGGLLGLCFFLGSIAAGCTGDAPTSTSLVVPSTATTTTAASVSTAVTPPLRASTTTSTPVTRTTVGAGLAEPAATTDSPPAGPTAVPPTFGPVPIVFPLERRVSFKHEYQDQRTGHLHQGVDLFAPKMTKEVAVVAGVVTLQVEDWNGRPWYSLWLAGDDGHGYSYSHENNDTPGTDDGKGGVKWAFAPGIRTGSHVEQGQFIAYCGDSGNAEVEGPQLHFEIHQTTSMSSPVIDPYDSLYRAPLAGGGSPPAWPVAKLTIYEQSDSKITYTGAWTSVAQSGASGGSYRSADSKATALVWFEGTRVDLVATKADVEGIASLSLDGGSPVSVNLYAAGALAEQTVWSSGDLAEGTHTVRLSWTGNAGGGGSAVDIDAIRVTGKLIQAPELTTIQQSDSLLKYKGAWATSSAGGASAGSFKRADAAGASVTLQFSGIYAAWIAETGPGWGQARLTLDGGDSVVVDLHTASALHQQHVWSSGIMADGTHTLKIERLGPQDPTASGSGIDVDALQLIGALDAVGSASWWGPADFTTITAR